MSDVQAFEEDGMARYIILGELLKLNKAAYAYPYHTIGISVNIHVGSDSKSGFFNHHTLTIFAVNDSGHEIVYRIHEKTWDNAIKKFNSLSKKINSYYADHLTS